MSGRDALIVGGGIGGLTAALCLAATGARVRVLEQAADFGEIGAGIQISPNASRVLHHLGLETALSRIAFMPEGVEMRDWKSGAVLASNPLGEAARRAYGAPYYHVHRADLLDVLVAAARAESRIELLSDVRAEGVEQSSACATVIANGARHQAACVIGADGIRSTVQAALFGTVAPTFTGCVAWRALVPTSALPEGLVRPMATAWWGPGRHFVHYYVRGGELVNCVCVVEKAGWLIESWTERGEHAELARDFAGWHRDVQTMIDAMDRDACYKWALFDRPPLPCWSVGRVTLLGDACHPTLPFMAQGAAMAIEDAAVLARCIAAHDDVATALARYESLRRARTAAIQAGSRRNARVFHLRGLAAWLRNRAVVRARDNAMDWLYRYDALAVAV